MFRWSRRVRCERRVAFAVGATEVVAVSTASPLASDLELDSCARRSLDSLEELPRALASLCGEADLRGARATAVLSPDLYEIRMVDAPDVEVEEMSEAVRWLVGDLVDFGPEDATVDYLEIPEIARRGRKQRLYVVVARNSVTEAIVEASESAGLVLETIDIGDLALRNLAAQFPEDVQGVALLTLAESKGRLSISRCGQLYLTRSSDVGSRQIENASETSFNEEDDDARNESLDALLLEIQRSLDYYESQFDQPPVAELLVAPCAGRETLLAFLEKNLSVSVRALPVEHYASGDIPEEVLARALFAIGALLPAQLEIGTS